jgi:N-acetylglucosamine kinase-like BadF-type ATPase
LKYLIGMDGGGTKTKCILTDFNLDTIFETAGGPSNFLVIGTEKVSKTVQDLVKHCLSSQKISAEEIYALVLGTTGGGRRTDAEILENQIFNDSEKNDIKIKRIRVESDARIALEGAFTGESGSILIAGTGSIMFGKDEAGQIHRVGGFGRYIGDEGSGYRIGWKALNIVARKMDGRGVHTKISDMLLSEFSISSGDELITEVYRNNFDIASVAPIVFNAAEKGDKTAQKILAEEADELILHIKAMKSKLNVKLLKLSLIGSLLTTANYFSYLFNEKVVREFDDVKIIEAEHSPEFGAALMAKQLA